MSSVVIAPFGLDYAPDILTVYDIVADADDDGITTRDVKERAFEDAQLGASDVVRALKILERDGVLVCEVDRVCRPGKKDKFIRKWWRARSEYGRTLVARQWFYGRGESR